ncbi:ecto-NOX disulfide-thiol exchanger 2-like [Maniola jurtina]|uniref:ecto-NOX disulfide-thiol exchanger 2-like n=1 Tax=Maniola jurtina TaxID=191418 RepID=UPI001E686A9E|nr:ecto-NOX disulfide-thiol exchanger 2-like [Maniola jurtina]
MKAAMSGRRDRSRSPMRANRRDKPMEQIKNDASMSSSVMNPMMMQNMMMSQGNMMMPGMFNMMMPNAMMGSGIMQPTGMDMMQSSGMEMSAMQPAMDMSAIGSAQPMQPPPQPMDMGLMGGVMMDPMMGMYPNMSAEAEHEKKEIVLKHCKLIPPASGSTHPPRRARPPGCRTIFVGGLPEKIRESTVREIFERYGRIHILRLSKKNFCHIRFDRESCVDAAMAISGYRIKLLTKEKDSKDDKEDDEDSQATNGWLHVDYALSRDDQNEYERRQRQALRVQQQQMQQLTAQQEAMASRSMNYRRSPSPARIQLFSNAAMVQLSEKIKNEEHFASTLPTLIAWLERGECSKKTSNQFYSMIQATNSHIRRLFGEKMQAEEELQECKERVKNHIQSVIEQLEQVAKVFNAATHQRVWDHFTKPQRKNIETWQKMTQEFNALKEEFNDKFFGEESDFNGYNKSNSNFDMNNEEVQQLKRENESLQFQLEAYKNEVDVIKADAQKEMEKFKAQFIARQALQVAMEKNPPLPSPVVKPPPPPPLPDDVDSKVPLKEEIDVKCGEAKLIGIMSAFLQVHPHGASLDYVVSYVRALFPSVSQGTIHHVLQKHDEVFQRSSSGVGANIETRWTFVAFANAAV